MKVAILCDKINVTRHGGSNYSIHRLATELSSHIDVTVYTINWTFENDPPETVYPIEKVDLGSTKISSLKGLRGFLSGLDCDVIHSYLPNLHGPIGLVNPDTPTVGHLNAYTPICSNSAMMSDQCWTDCGVRKKYRHARDPGLDSLVMYTFEEVVSRRTMTRLDQLIGLSPQLAAIYGGVGMDVDVIPNMYDPTFPTTSATTDQRRILYAGRTDYEKGIDVLLQAAEQVDCQIDVVGDDILDRGISAAELKRTAPSNVRVHGWIDYTELAQYYAAADVFIHPGRWHEPFGRTILEALQHDCAVISSDVGAPPWVAGSAGTTFENGNADMLATKLELSNTQIEQMQENAADELQRFSPDIVVDQIMEVYNDVR